MRSADTAPAPLDLGHFSGDVRAGDLGAYDEPSAAVLVVTFPAGARTHWHRHPGGQFLYVTAGTGRIGIRAGSTVEVTLGDLVHAPPGEEHWHGAAEDESVTHLALSFGATDWLEEVEP